MTILLLVLALCQHVRADALEDLRLAVKASDWTKAKSVGEVVTAERSENGEAYYLLGKAYAGLGEREAAVEAYQNAVRFEKSNADYYADYGYALIQRGQEMNMFQAGPTYMRALDQYKEAVKIDPDHLGAHIGLSRYYTNAPAIGGGSLKKAKEHAAEIARINPYMGHIENALIAQKENRTDAAIEQFEAAAAMKGDDAWVHFELGKLYQTSGNLPEAKASYEKVLALDANHEEAKAALDSLGG